VVIVDLKVATKQWVLTEGSPESHLSVFGGHRTGIDGAFLSVSVTKTVFFIFYV
jgi:hypothetical protein